MEVKVYNKKPNDFSPKVEVVATYVTVQGNLLLLEIGSNKPEKGAWGVPAGKLEQGENPKEGAKRELFEETGIEIPAEEPFHSLGQLYMRKPHMDYIYHFFSVNLKVLPPVQLSSEHCSYKWVSIEQAERLPLMDGAKQALEAYYQLSPVKCEAKGLSEINRKRKNERSRGCP